MILAISIRLEYRRLGRRRSSALHKRADFTLTVVANSVLASQMLARTLAR